MATVVQTIKDNFITQISTAVGAGWSELDYTFDIEKNSFRGNDKRYGVRPLAATQAEGIIKNYTLDHDFEVILTHGYINRANTDSDQESKMYLLYDKMSEIVKQVYATRLGVAASSIKLLHVFPISLDEPEFLEEQKVVVLRGVFTIKYREQLN